MKVYEVPANDLVTEVAKELKKNKEMAPPEWIHFVKSGAHNERRPDDAEAFWYMRCASILRKLYVYGNVGINTLKREYGGSKSRGTRKNKHVDAGGSIIRKAMQKLEKAGFVEKQKKGRILAKGGKSLLDKVAKAILKVTKKEVKIEKIVTTVTEEKVEKPVKKEPAKHDKKEEKHEGGDKRKSAGGSKKKEAA